MNQTGLGFEIDLRITPKPVVLGLILSGIIAFALSFFQNEVFQSTIHALFGLFIIFLAGTAWRLEQDHSLFARWVTVGTITLEVASIALWFDLPEILVLAFVPVGFAAALIGLSASGGVALGETVFLLALFIARPIIPTNYFALILVSIWLTFGMMLAVYRPVIQVSGWAWEHYRAAQSLLDETRNRKAELEQALQELAEANRQLIRLNKLAQNLRHTADDLRSAKEKFVANVSHELRTPINMIIGYTRMILEKPTLYGKKIPAGVMADLAVIERNANHLSDLINDILDLSQVEAGEMALVKESVNFREIIEFSVSAVQPLYKLKGLYLETELPLNLPNLFCDPIRMREVMLNLLSNAGRFTSSGGVRIRAWEENQNLYIAVADTGPGIAHEDIGRLFTPFEQLDYSIQKKYGGTGLGLAISKRFIEMHDGKIWVESKPGEGSTFIFRIPIREEQKTAGGAARWLNRYSPSEQRHHVPNLPKAADRGSLVVLEHGSSFTRLLSRYMNEVEVVPATDLSEANQKLKDSPASALLMNHPAVRNELVSIEGFETIEAGTPVIAFSLPGLSADRANFQVADILVKPISRGQLLDCLQALGIREGTILIADDDPDALQLFGRMLTSAEPPYRVRLARDGKEVLDILRETRPDALLLDLAMPNLSGYQLLRERDNYPELQNIPIVIISARDPSGQPNVTDLLIVTQKEGFSIRQLLACIKALCQVLSPVSLPDDPEPQADLPG